ncbi:hypothetical protein GCM10023085_31590 [Actinomadura viridis]|uniref:Acyl carrier protein n=1 Tax=Actinomadura viridis TaxID=58110 RepID=A0A931GKW5_9ACTN|nr:hypothetical protein [Actinomadura viridis]MBG6086841.1 acyl carrier protein [Actinomadura viridis]
MHRFDDFPAFVRYEVGLPVGAGDLDLELDRLPGWDSLYLLRLLLGAEAATGRRLDLADLLEARTLREVRALLEAGDAP